MRYVRNEPIRWFSVRALPFSAVFLHCYGRTYGRTDTASHRDARTHLKIQMTDKEDGVSISNDREKKSMSLTKPERPSKMRRWIWEEGMEIREVRGMWARSFEGLG